MKAEIKALEKEVSSGEKEVSEAENASAERAKLLQVCDSLFNWTVLYSSLIKLEYSHQFSLVAPRPRD